MLAAVRSNDLIDFSRIYHLFNAPISEFGCGEKCAPHNERAVPFCCDIQHTVPTMYDEEWDYLKQNTDLWHELKKEEVYNFDSLIEDVPPEQVLAACKGHRYCQRDYRAVTCRAFPFFPYINNKGDFLGLAYYWEYEDRCWIISNLHVVSQDYIDSFVTSFEHLFRRFPIDRESFRFHTRMMHEEFKNNRRAIPLIHRNGNFYKISPKNGRLRKISNANFPKFGSYKVAQELPFPDEE